ncbi:FAD/NAD(P)-binding oxidoreductase [Kribbella sp. ALI-6-A]|uniref:FAD-dependent oxidoreductase n=1 Tax=Kribbella sp. ALI-6-A TaxID=1933817 RepID=UPI00097C72F5|nr:FAD-dependent oxidoreductase [Kribbella sp. ALI-6-A]ONI68315.1 FAD/NAD(P)-binding oxidoreductase [Kribbella sp. ALI-6-A]
MSPHLRSPEGDPAEPRFGPAVQVTVDGKAVEALPGQTVAAALMATGRESWRTTRGAGDPRGVFCGIGACFDCLVVVNGTPDVRACQRTVAAGDRISTQAGAVLPTDDRVGAQDASAVHAASEPRTAGLAAFDVVVVGAGPAGLNAALAAAEGGVSVALVDAGRAVGGQFHRQLPEEFAAARPRRLQHGWTGFVQLRDRVARHHQVTHWAETSVWAIERTDDGHRLWVQRGPADTPGRRVEAVEARAVVLAPGAFDRVLPFKGWELPGVYSAGAAQALAKGQRITVGQRVVLAGTGPFLLPVAESLLGVGSEVVGLYEANSLRTVGQGWLSDPLVARGKLREAATYAALLARRGIRLHHGRAVVAAHGDRHVEAVTVAKLDSGWRPIRGTEQVIEADAVCVGYGFTAQLELAVAARCDLTAGPDGGAAVVTDDQQETSTPGVFAAGEIAGIGGADLAAAEGRVAGAAAARQVAAAGAPAPAPAPAPASGAVPRAGSAPAAGARTFAGARAVAEVAQGKRFAKALAAAYPVRDGWLEWSDDATLVCRCEEVSRGDLARTAGVRALEAGRSLKLAGRVGLGLCQGRVCSRNAACVSGGRRGVVPDDHRRPIAVPVRLGDLADQEEL